MSPAGASNPDSASHPAYSQPPPLLGDYELLDRVGEGAMGTVYKARQRSMDRIVAVKVLKPVLARNAEYVERFWREARAAARLSHPNIVLAIDAGEDQGFYYFAMEYVEGHTVGLLLKAGPLEETPALRIALQVAQALEYAWTHERIVHRDIKPGNLIITPNGTAKLADLGLAHEADLAGEDVSTEGGKILGTPSYMSPEQIRRAELDVRSDLYSLGASLFHMVTGRPPFEGADTKAVLAQHLFEPPPDPRKVCPGLSEGVARIILRLLAKDRGERYPAAQALVADIEAHLEAPAPRAPVEQAAPRLRHVPRRHVSQPSQLLTLAAVLAVAALLTMVLTSGRGCRSRQPDTGAGTEPPGASLAAQLAYEAAEAYAEANPADTVGAIPRYRDIESSYPDTAYAASAAGRRKQLETELDQKARETLDGLKRRAEALVQQGKYTDALAALGRFPDGLATPAWRDRLAAARAAAERAARQRFDADLARGKEALGKDELDEALRIYQSLGDSLPPAWRDEAAQRVEAVRQRQRDLAGQAKAEKEAAHLRRMAQIGALYRKRDYDGAAQLIRSALEAEPGAYRAELQRELDEIDRIKAFWRAAELGAKSLIGQPYSVRGIRGLLVSVDAGKFTVEAGKSKFTQELATLQNSDIVKLALPMLGAGSAPLETARFLIAQGDLAGAEESLKALEAAGTNVADLRARIRRLTSGDPQATARAELDDARRTLAAGKTAEAAAALRAFLDRYKDREPLAPFCAEAKTLLDQAAAPKPPPQATSNARLRIACEGRYKVYLNGKSVGGGEYREGAFEEIPLTVKSGDILAVEAPSKDSYRGLYAVLSVDDGTHMISTDATWRWSPDAGEGWQTDPLVEAKWGNAQPAYWPHVKPGYAQAGRGLPGYWIWGRGERCFFRKTIQLQKTAAALEAEERAAEKALTAKLGPAAKATLWITCREAYILHLNGKIAGCAAAFLPQGAAYALSVRQGDILGVEAAAAGQPGALEARLEVEGYPNALCTDRSWVYSATAPRPDDWSLRGTPSGRWRAPDYLDAASHRIWGDGQTLHFRKTIDLKRIEPGRFRRLLYFCGSARTVEGGRIEVTYDFRDPEQLADWHSERPWVWAKGGVAGSGGIFYTMPYHVDGLQFDAQIESASDLAVGIWGDDATRGNGYTLSLGDLRQGNAVLRRNVTTLDMGRFPPGPGTRRISLSVDSARRKRGEFRVSVDGRRIIDTDDDNPIPPADLWRVGLRAGPGGNTLIGSVRITGNPDWTRLRTEAARRGGASAAPAPDEK
jgi:hypothetical protein